MPEEHAHVYAEGVRRGGTLVSVRADDSQVEAVEGIMAEYNAVDADARGALYRESGWERFDEEAPPISETEIDAERDRLSSATRTRNGRLLTARTRTGRHRCM